jgi:hypothetical protein
MGDQEAKIRDPEKNYQDPGSRIQGKKCTGSQIRNPGSAVFSISQFFCNFI